MLVRAATDSSTRIFDAVAAVVAVDVLALDVIGSSDTDDTDV
jgi:hypothetical protein